MSQFEYPTIEGAEEVAMAMGIPVCNILDHGQDWEYCYPNPEDLTIYEEIYRLETTSDLAKRVLGCFFFQSLEDFLAGGCSEDFVRERLLRLARDYQIHEQEFEYWAMMGDSHDDQHPEDAWNITALAREFRTHFEPKDQLDP